jgi:hypothetical protein
MPDEQRIPDQGGVVDNGDSRSLRSRGTKRDGAYLSLFVDIPERPFLKLLLLGLDEVEQVPHLARTRRQARANLASYAAHNAIRLAEKGRDAW